MRPVDWVLDRNIHGVNCYVINARNPVKKTSKKPQRMTRCNGSLEIENQDKATPVGAKSLDSVPRPMHMAVNEKTT